MVELIQPSFSKGELSPELHGRVDINAYRTGLATARNAVIHTYGGVSRRQGTKYIAPVKDHTVSPRLIEFLFKTSDKYILEFGDQYMRVIRNDGHVLESSVNISGITQANPGVVTATSHGYSNGDEVYIESVVGMVEVNQNRYVVASATANTFELTHQVTGANIDTSSFTAYSSGGTVARIYEISTPWSIADVYKLTYTQSADVMTFCHSSYRPRELTRTGHTSWTISDINIGPTRS